MFTGCFRVIACLLSFGCVFLSLAVSASGSCRESFLVATNRGDCNIARAPLSVPYSLDIRGARASFDCFQHLLCSLDFRCAPAYFGCFRRWCQRLRIITRICVFNCATCVGCVAIGYINNTIQFGKVPSSHPIRIRVHTCSYAYTHTPPDSTTLADWAGFRRNDSTGDRKK